MSCVNGVHYPANPDKFEFDEEVTQVFDDMARRSIPMYEEVHSLHAAIIAEERSMYLSSQLHKFRSFSIVDIGASTGQLFKALYDELEIPYAAPIPFTDLYALEPSAPMAAKIRERFPHVKVFEESADRIAQLTIESFDVVCLNYVLQFIAVSERVSLLKKIHASIERDGLFLMSQKEKIENGFSRCFDQRYIQMRRDNGYSQEEIDRKTAALANSMWPQSFQQTRHDLSLAGFLGVQEISRWLNFNSLACRAG